MQESYGSSMVNTLCKNESREQPGGGSSARVSMCMSECSVGVLWLQHKRASWSPLMCDWNSVCRELLCRCVWRHMLRVMPLGDPCSARLRPLRLLDRSLLMMLRCCGLILLLHHKSRFLDSCCVYESLSFIKIPRRTSSITIFCARRCENVCSTTSFCQNSESVLHISCSHLC